MIRCPKFFYLKLLTVPSQEHNAVNFDRLISSQTRQPLLVKSLPSVDFFWELTQGKRTVHSELYEQNLTSKETQCAQNCRLQVLLNFLVSNISFCILHTVLFNCFIQQWHCMEKLDLNHWGLINNLSWGAVGEALYRMIIHSNGLGSWWDTKHSQVHQ